eukprot:COSAG01_NODE_4331_length_5128_cov_8.120501_5_plen_722_part_00
MAWQPDAASVGQVVSMLQQAQIPDSATQAAITAQLEQLQTVPEFNQTLVHVFIRLLDQPINVRVGAGLILKNNIKRHVHTMPPQLATALKSEILHGVVDQDRRVRRTVGTCVSTFARGMGHKDEWLQLWPDLMPALSACLDAGATVEATDGALDCLSKICEEVPDRMVADASSPLDVILPKLFGFLTSDYEAFRVYSLGIMNQFILLDPPVMRSNQEVFLQALFHLCSDPAPGVRKHVCAGINALLDVNFAELLPHINGVIEFMMHSMADPGVALDAVDFWGALISGGTVENQTKAIDALRPHLTQILPLLLNGMVYDESDPSMEYQDDEDDAHIEDKPEDIAPVFGKSKAQEDDEGDDDGDAEQAWNLRKGSASSLDQLSMVFKGELLQVLMPLLEQLLQSEDWHRRESGILALGAISDGCGQAVSEHMAALMPFMLAMVDDAKPLVRSISCWAISRYSQWVVAQSEETVGAVLGKFSSRCVDNNKRVQEAAVSALAVLQETGGPVITPFVGSVIQVIVACLAKYQAKNLLILFDATATLADAVGHTLAQPEHISALVPPILSKWEQMADDSPALIPCTECLAALIHAVGSQSLPFVEPLYTRALRMTHARTAALSGPEDPPTADAVVVGLDMVSSMLEKLKHPIAPLVASTNTVPILVAAAQRDDNSEMKRILFAVIGDLCNVCWDQVQPHAATILPLLMQHLNPNYISVCNNAAWCAA